MIATKICGITRVEDAIAAEKYGAHAVGFIFYDKSPRNISFERAASISNSLSNIKTIGVFVDAKKDFIQKAISKLYLDAIQLHGNESPEFCMQFNIPVIKAIRVDKYFNLNQIKDYQVSAILFDTFNQNKIGGTGNTFDWSLVQVRLRDMPIILSGGLNRDNILIGIKKVRPSAVDINSGVEDLPGIKNHKKINHILNSLKTSINEGYNFD